jgi:uncharacterized membrane protein
MHWFLIAVVGPVLWAIVNYIDKYLLSRFTTTKNDIGSLMLFSTLSGIFVLPLALYIEPQSVHASLQHILILLIVGILSASAIWLYLLALYEDEVSIIVPLFQTIPLFGYLFSYLLLGEVLSIHQGFGGALLILGSVILTLEVDEERKVRLKKKVLMLMLGSAALFGLFESLFKFVAVDIPFWTATFWEHVGLLLVGMLLLCIPRYRTTFIRTLRKNWTLPSLNIVSEILTITGNIATNYALLLAPVALVLVVAGIQSFIVLIVGALASVIIPNLVQEKIEPRHLIHKLAACAVLGIGVVMIQ